MFDGATLAFYPDVFARLRARVARRDPGARVVPIDDVVAVFRKSHVKDAAGEEFDEELSYDEYDEAPEFDDERE